MLQHSNPGARRQGHLGWFQSMDAEFIYILELFGTQKISANVLSLARSFSYYSTYCKMVYRVMWLLKVDPAGSSMSSFLCSHFQISAVAKSQHAECGQVGILQAARCPAQGC